jgi:hypothetical protein
MQLFFKDHDITFNVKNTFSTDCCFSQNYHLKDDIGSCSDGMFYCLLRWGGGGDVGNVNRQLTRKKGVKGGGVSFCFKLIKNIVKMH